MTGFSSCVCAVITARSERWCEVATAGCEGRATDIHHRRARGSGGTKRPETNEPANGLAACRACHGHIESHRTEALENGWLVPQHCDPRDVPVQYRGTVVYLDNYGNMHDQKPGAA